MRATTLSHPAAAGSSGTLARGRGRRGEIGTHGLRAAGGRPPRRRRRGAVAIARCPRPHRSQGDRRTDQAGGGGAWAHRRRVVRSTGSRPRGARRSTPIRSTLAPSPSPGPPGPTRPPSRTVLGGPCWTSCSSTPRPGGRRRGRTALARGPCVTAAQDHQTPRLLCACHTYRQPARDGRVRPGRGRSDLTGRVLLRRERRPHPRHGRPVDGPSGSGDEGGGRQRATGRAAGAPRPPNQASIAAAIASTSPAHRTVSSPGSRTSWACGMCSAR
jgi:hypothetical protein